MGGVVHYSAGTEETGRALAGALSYGASKKAPPFADYDVYVGWGSRRPKGWDSTGVDRLVSSGKLRILNHLSAIFENRDKVSMLERLTKAGLGAPGLVVRQENQGASGFRDDVDQALANGVIAFPLLGLTRTNRGLPHFCFVEEDITRALVASINADGTVIDYFRSFAPGAEYRVHILRDSVILAQAKVQSTDPLKDCITDIKSRLGILREKERKIKLEPLEEDWIIRQIAPEMLQGPNHILRSLKRGWELRDVDVKGLPDEVVLLAINALEVCGLDLGAVSISFDGNRARVTNITTGPALEKQHIPLYVSSIESFAGRDVTANVSGEKGKTSTREPKGPKLASTEQVTKIAQDLMGMTETKAAAILKMMRGN